MEEASQAIEAYTGGDREQVARLELARDECLRELQDEDKRYQIAKDLAENLSVSYNTTEVVMARLMQSTDVKERVYSQAVSFFGTNETVFTALNASFTSLQGLHESTRTLEAMKEGVNQSLETIAEVGGKVQEDALRAGYGPTLKAESVKKLVDAVVNFQDKSRALIAEMRELAARNELEISRAVEDGKRRMVELAREGATLEMPEPTEPKKFALDEVMLAMDVVDTLRHQRSLVERELQSEDREQELVEKLRKIYADQGLEVSDEVIAQGVRAMREERFAYRPPKKGLKTRLAHVYVHRGRWAKGAVILLIALAAVWAGYRFLFVLPAERGRTELARELTGRAGAQQERMGGLRARVESIGKALQKALGQVSEAEAPAVRRLADRIRRGWRPRPAGWMPLRNSRRSAASIPAMWRKNRPEPSAGSTNARNCSTSRRKTSIPRRRA